MKNDTKDRIKALLEQSDLTAPEIAARVGIGRSGVNKALGDLRIEGLRLRVAGQRLSSGKGRPMPVYSLRRGKLIAPVPGAVPARVKQRMIRRRCPVDVNRRVPNKVPERHPLLAALFGAPTSSAEAAS